MAYSAAENEGNAEPGNGRCQVGEREGVGGSLTCAASSPSFACTIKQAEGNGDGTADQEHSLNRSRRAVPDKGARGGGHCFLAPAPHRSPHRGHGRHPAKNGRRKDRGPSERSPCPAATARSSASNAFQTRRRAPWDFVVVFSFPFRPCRRISRPASVRSHRLNLRTRTDTPLAAAESTRPNGGAWAREEGERPVRGERWRDTGELGKGGGATGGLKLKGCWECESLPHRGLEKTRVSTCFPRAACCVSERAIFSPFSHTVVKEKAEAHFWLIFGSASYTGCLNRTAQF